MRKGDDTRYPDTNDNTMSLFPPQVVLYIPGRTGFKGLILMDVSYQENVYTLAPVVNTVSSQYTVNMPATGSTGTYFGRLVMKTSSGILLNKTVKQHLDITIVAAHAGSPVSTPVISISQHTIMFGSHILKHNFDCVPTTANNSSPLTPPKKKIVRCLVTALNPYVAKQLFDLAILRKEQCPIAAEEFTVGNTAVMPCGHLFLKAAIEETFKVEANKCPWCRQEGAPAYI